MSATVNSFATSFAQRRLWFLQAMSPASWAYNMVCSTPLPFTPEPRALQWAVDALVARHEVLRTSFGLDDGEPVQHVHDRARVLVRLSGPERSAEEFAASVAACAAEPFVLSSLPLARVLAHCVPGRSRVALVIHHSIADGQTLRILIEELLALYRAHVAQEILALPPLRIQYADYAEWQRRCLRGARLQRLREYWMKRLDSLPELVLNHDGAATDCDAAVGGALPFRIPAPVVAQLRALASESRVTLFATLLAGFSAVLARFSGQSTVAIGTPVSGRTRAELERVAGLFVNSLVFRADVAATMTFGELVCRTGARLAEDLAHQELPFEDLVEALGARRRADRNPVFQVMIQLQTGASTARDSDDSGLRPERVSSQLDLSLIQYECSDGSIDGWAVYSPQLFSPESIAQVVEAYALVLAEGARCRSKPLAELPVLTNARRAHMLALGEGAERQWPEATSLSAWLAQQAARSPGACAVVDGAGVTSFGQLEVLAGRVAAGLARHSGSVIAICLPRSIDLVAAIVGVLKAGCAFLCLDPRAPRQRNRFILTDSKATHAIVVRGNEDLVADTQVAAMVLADLPDAATPTPAQSRPEQPAYVIYTSGSTGEPKGVVIPDGALVNHMRWMLERFELTGDDRVLQRTPLTFDASIWELFAPLLSGATLVLAPEQRQFDPAQLLATIREQRISVLQVVPSLLRALVAQGGLARCAALRRVFCGGEALNRSLCEAFFAQSQAELCNLYGPTETTIDATFHVVPRQAVSDVVPIGRPIANVVARVLDASGTPVPVGVVGELYIGGAAVGLGYLGRAELTAQRFVADPLRSGDRLFRSGDRVRMRHDGVLEYLGRVDDQVKLRGFRIELAEIDAILQQHPAVAEAASVVQRHGEGDERLIAFCTGTQHDRGDLESELRAWLRNRLPAHAVPSMVVVQASLPKSAHGKVDRAALAQQRLAPAHSLRPGPRNRIERDVCATFGAVLGSAEVAIDDDFFLLGGHSLLVIKVCAALTQACTTPVSVVDVYEYPTPRQLAAVLTARASAAAVEASA
jgi:amino acid adenylation domain-containing protein